MADEPVEQQPVEPTPEPVEPEPVQQEFDFRAAYQEQQRQLAVLAQTMASYVQSQRQPAPQPVQSSRPATLDELWARAQQGDQAAFDEWQDRKVEAKFNQRMQATTRSQATAAQINSLFQKYPEFADASHPLTLKANQFYQVLIQMGGAPGQETQLDAMLRAAADSREIVSTPPQTRVTTRPVASGQMGVSHQAPAAAASRQPVPTQKEAELASRMGIKDVNKARERFQKRQAEGKSSVHHSIAAYLEGQNQ